MGTSKAGRCMNTKGSGTSPSHFAIVHSNEGKYVRGSKGFRLASGGHGQTGMNELKKYGIEYHIVKTYPNGVRVGYIPNHQDKRKKNGMNQAWFPKDWTSKDIKHAGEHVAALKGNRHVKDGIKIWGMWKGVRVGVIRTYGKIATIFPDSNQPIKRRK